MSTTTHFKYNHSHSHFNKQKLCLLNNTKPCLITRRKLLSKPKQHFNFTNVYLFMTKLNAFSYSYNHNKWNQADYKFYPMIDYNIDQERPDKFSQPEIGTWISIFKSAFNASNSAISNLIYQITPEWISRKTVSSAVKAGLILLCLILARAVLSLVITCTLIFSAIYFAIRLINKKKQNIPMDESRNSYPNRFPGKFPYHPPPHYPHHPQYYPGPYYYNMQSMDPRFGKYIAPKKDVINVWREPYNPYILPYHGQYPSPSSPYLNYYNAQNNNNNYRQDDDRRQDKKDN